MPPDSDAPSNEPNLELPSFGFGRRKKRDKSSDEAEQPASPPEEAAAPDSDPSAQATEDTAFFPVADSPEPAPVTPPRAPSTPPTPARVPTAGPTPARPAARPAARPVTPATPSPAAAAPSPPRPAQAKPPAPSPAAGDEHGLAGDEADTTAPTVIDPLAAAAAALDQPRRSRPDRGRSRGEARSRKREEKATRERQDRTEPRSRKREAKAAGERTAPAQALVARLPRFKPLYAALLTGALSGLAAVLLAVGASRGCEAVRDSSSCGGALGLLATVVILALEVVVGASLLKAWRIPDPVSTSFLGVGLVAIIAMLTFLSHINSIWMLLVIPLMTAGAFALSWWVTVRFIDEYDTGRPPPAAAGTTASDRDVDVDASTDQDSRA